MERTNASSEISQVLREQEIIIQLTELLRGYGEKILSGQSKLSLTTRSLCVLNANFATLLGEDELITSFDVMPPNSPKLHLAQNIQFLYDFMQKTLALKILHISSTLQGRVNLGPFKALRTLEIKKTPLHLLEGIQRMRGRLHTVICARSLSTLQELFETCGGDLSSPMSWPELRTACLSFNMIEKLDSSLRLVPGLEILDLSHNSIKDTDCCLEYLTEVSVVNLGYNKIIQVPTFAISARTKLTTLILRNNNLEKLDGIQDLLGLRDLDVSDNCLCEHSTLSPLRSLHRLGFLVTRGNPLSYHDTHRLLAIIQLNRTAANRMTLDGHPVSQPEIQAAQKLAMTSQSLRSQGSCGQDTLTSRGSQSSFEVSFESGTLNDTSDGTARPGRTRHTGRANRRVRQAPISDLDSGCDAESDVPPVVSDSSKPSTPRTTEHLDVKKHMETMRNQLGPDWLQTLVHNRRKTAEEMNGPRPQQNTAKSRSSQNQHAEKSGSSPVENGHHTQEAEQISIVREIPWEAREPRLAHFAIGSLNEDSEDTEEFLIKNHSDDPKPPVPSNFNYPPSHRNSRAGFADNSDTLSDHIIELTESEEKTEKLDIVEDVIETNTLVKSAEFDTIYDKQRHTSHQDEVDYGLESEPVIVSYLSDSDIQHLVSITQRYLLEKDINGDVIEALDLRCLKLAEVLAFGAVAEDRFEDDASDDHGGRVLKLTFDHVRKDKRERLYLIEDEDSCKSLQELLQPVVEANIAEALLRDQMQCLKCSRELSKKQCSRTIRRHGSIISTSDVFSTSVERDDLIEVLLCPYCGSDMLIKVDNDKQQPVTTQTPVGSFKEPVATSSTNTSPWKRTESPVYCPDKSTSDVGSLKSNQEASSFHSAMDTTNFISPKGSIFMTPTASESDLTSAYRPEQTEEGNQLSMNSKEDFSTQFSNTSLKTVYMSQSVIEVSSQQAENMGDFASENSVTTPTENRAFQRNHSGHDLNRYRKRQDSGSSDILVLSQHPNLHTFASQESDITLLSNPSQSSIAVIDSAVCSRETLNELDADGHFVHPRTSLSLDTVREGGDYIDPMRESDLSPAGSLTNKTLTSMVNSVYEKSIFDAGSIVSNVTNESESGSCDDTIDGVTVVSGEEAASSWRSNSSTPRAITNSNPFSKQKRDSTGYDKINPCRNDDRTPTPTSGLNLPFTNTSKVSASENPGRMRFCYTDFSQIDHRLKLYLMMSHCSHEDEELQLVNRCGLWHYAKAEEIAGLVVVSSLYIYFFKVTGPERTENPDKWLKLIQSYPVVSLWYVDIGLGHQTLRLEFSPDSACFALIIRDATRCQQFTGQFTAHVQSIAFNTNSKLEGITKNNPITMENLRLQVFENAEEQDGEDDEDENSLVCFVMAYQHTGEICAAGEKRVRPVSLVLTQQWLHLVDENLSWPVPRGCSEPTKGQQFTCKDRQQITDITHLDLYTSAPLDVNIIFYDEQSSEECTWRVTMETVESLTLLVQSIKELWDEQFGVDLHINTDDI